MKTRLTLLLVIFTMGSQILAVTAFAQTVPKMKMTTPIPEAIVTPDKVMTERLGALEFVDGFPTDATTQKLYDNLDFMALYRR